jgi:hypothetical protein
LGLGGREQDTALTTHNTQHTTHNARGGEAGERVPISERALLWRAWALVIGFELELEHGSSPGSRTGQTNGD